MPAHYLFAQGPSVREFVNPGYTVTTYAKKRWLEATTVASLGLNLGLPFMQEVNTHLDIQIKQLETTGAENEDFKQMFTEAWPVAAAKASEFVSRCVTHTVVVASLLKNGSMVSLSIVHAFDSYQRVHFEYYSRFLRTVRLSPSIASLFGAPPQGNDVPFFETRPLAVSAAAEDAVKRHIILFITDITVGAAFEVIRAKNPQLSPIAARKAAAGGTAPTSTTRAVLLNSWKTTSIRYACVVAGAVLGSRFAWRNGEYVGEVAGTLVAMIINGQRLERAKQAAAARVEAQR